jgi:hypothetical protein
VALRLADVDVPWYVAAGWGLDLFLGRQTREHEDLEIAVPRARLAQILDAFPGYELHAASSHQTWLREPATGLWRLDVFAEPSDGDTWVCRREEQIRLPYAQVIERTAGGVPYGRPEIILLFKAKRARPKDDADFETVLPELDATRRRWLADALDLVHPGHRWLGRLRD